MKKKKSFLRFLPLILATAILIVVLFVPSPIDACTGGSHYTPPGKRFPPTRHGT